MWDSFWDELEKIALSRELLERASDKALDRARELNQKIKADPHGPGADKLRDLLDRALSQHRKFGLASHQRPPAQAYTASTVSAKAPSALRRYGIPAAAGAGALLGGIALYRHLKTRKKEKEKAAAMAGDLRMKTPGVKMTNAPTEDSKQFSFKQLTNSQKPGKFLNKTEPKHLIKPGPSIKQLATLPKG